VALLALTAGAPQRPLRCSLCGALLQGEYTRFEDPDLNVCPQCMRAPRCAVCGLPLAGRNRGDGVHCTRCIDQAPRCASCGRPIFDRYWEVTGREGRYCERCRSEAPACSVCGAPTRDGILHDGRVFCRSCDAKRVTDRGTYDRIYHRLIERARERLGLVLDDAPPLVVESQSRMEAHEGLPEAHEGLSGLYLRDAHGNASIHVLSDLPEGRLAAVLGHELAHAWQGEHCPDRQSQRVREGFAEWVSWHLLDGEAGADRERTVITARTDEYGRGFRLFEGLEEHHGEPFVLWWASAVRREDPAD
jgi:hypothetical protein